MVFMYMLLVNSFVLTDTVTLKSRYLIIGFRVLFVAINVYNLYRRTFSDDNSVVLVRWLLKEKLLIMKRSAAAIYIF